MSKFQNKKYEELKKAFYDCAKKILNYEKTNPNARPLRDTAKVEEFKQELLNTYNSLLIYTGTHFDTFLQQSQDTTKEIFLTKYQPYLERALETLGLECEIPQLFQVVTEIISLDTSKIEESEKEGAVGGVKSNLNIHSDISLESS